MLKITITRNANEVTMIFEGKLTGPWVAEAKKSWQSLEGSLASTTLTLDLRGLSFADIEGRQLLREIFRKTHAAFLTDSPLTKYYAEQAMQKAATNRQGGA
jgi:hypothetical protein